MATLSNIVSEIETYLVANTSSGFPKQVGLVGTRFPALEVVPTGTIIGGINPALDLTAQNTFQIAVRGVWLYSDNASRLAHADPSVAGSLTRAVLKMVTDNHLDGATILEWTGEWSWEAITLGQDDAEALVVAGETELLINVVADNV